jgi:hypothetical protein
MGRVRHQVLGLIAVCIESFILSRADVPIFEFCDVGSMAFGILQGRVVLEPDAKAVVVEEETAREWDGGARDERIGHWTARLSNGAGG